MSRLDADVARRHHQIRVELVAQLEEVLPSGWEASAACVWLPPSSDGLVLHPDVAVHRSLERGDRLPAPPALCVVLGDGPPPGPPAQAYARSGVDHHWHFDSVQRSLEVSVRVDDVYRRAETIRGGHAGSAAEPPYRTPSALSRWWVDFGVGVVSLDLSRLDPDGPLS